MSREPFTITCPSCNHFALTPLLAIERYQFEVRACGPFAAEKEFRKMFLPFLRWNCPGCRRAFIVSVCCLCGKDRLAEQNVRGDGSWQIECDECIHNRTVSG